MTPKPPAKGFDGGLLRFDGQLRPLLLHFSAEVESDGLTYRSARLHAADLLDGAASFGGCLTTTIAAHSAGALGSLALRARGDRRTRGWRWRQKLVKPERVELLRHLLHHTVGHHRRAGDGLCDLEESRRHARIHVRTGHVHTPIIAVSPCLL